MSKMNKTSMLNNVMTAFAEKHKDGSIVKAMALHYRTNVYDYIMGWLDRNKYNGKMRSCDVAMQLMRKYGLGF